MEENGVNMAAEPVVTYPTTSYADVMGYLHRIRLSPKIKESVAKRLLLEVTEPYLAKTFARIDHLSMLKADWDGHNAKKVSYTVLNNLRNVLLISDNNDWEYWMISPEASGALALQSKLHNATISIGDEEFSYYRSSEDGEEGKSHVKFSPELFLEIMRRIV
jgi:hypothetical protein